MKLFFPDSCDVVDPTFDFCTEKRSPNRIRQRDDLYAHEVLYPCPYHGLLVSKGIVDGVGKGNGKFTFAQRNRLLRVGAKEFYRIDNNPHLQHLRIIGDCGAFTYVKEKLPPYSVDQVIEFYESCGFDYGISVDHVILGFRNECDQPALPGVDLVRPEWRERQEITLSLAEDFLRTCKNSKVRFRPIGVAQGWSPASYAYSIETLQKQGYNYIALGGMVPLKTEEILSCLEFASSIRKLATQLHLLGVTRLDSIPKFKKYGVVSFDSTSPLMQAFKDDRDNYHTLNRTYMAIRVPQVDCNRGLKERIAAGRCSQEDARELERECLRALAEYDQGEKSVDDVLPSLSEYGHLYGAKGNLIPSYKETLESRPWKECPCQVCRELGIQVVIFRGAERNRRRGFHNLSVLGLRLRTCG